MKTAILVFAMVLSVLGFFGKTPPALAFRSDLSNYRCASGLVFMGDSERKVADRCGEANDSYIEENDDIWVYNFGDSRFVYYFTFTNGKLQRIRQVACDADNPDCLYFR